MKKTTKNDNNHRANQKNKNKGTSGANKPNAKVHGNRSKQLNPPKKGK